jgi:HD-like signal output (HDOD) protein
MAMPALVDRFVRDLGRVSDLPSKPQVLLRLISALADHDASLRDVAEIIREDAALAAQLIRIANSAIYAPRVRIFSTTDALMRIGLVQTRRMALALSLYNTVPRPEFFRHQQAFWLHSLGTAHAAASVTRRLAPDVGPFDEDQMFLLGLFHDVGLIALACHYPAEYEQVKAFGIQSRLPFDAAEAALLGTDHGELGAILATYWGFPTEAIEVIRSHHRLDCVPVEHARALRVLQLAEWLCREAGIADLGEGTPAALDSVLFEDLGLDQDSVQDLVWEARGETERAEAALAAGR